MNKTINAYEEVLNGNIILEDVDYELFKNIMKDWETKLIKHGGDKSIVINVCEQQYRDLEEKDNKENFKNNISKWLNENK